MELCMSAALSLPWMLLDELIALRLAKQPPILTPKQQSQIQDAANWGVLEEPRYDAKPMPEFVQLFSLFESPTEATRAVREKYGSWALGTISGYKTTITRELLQAEETVSKAKKS